MASLIGKVIGNAAATGGPPVPLGGDVLRTVPGTGPDASRDERLMRAYNTQGTVHSNVWTIAVNVASTPWALFRVKTDGRRRYSTGDTGSDQREEVLRHPAINLLNKPAVVTIDGEEKVFWTRSDLMALGQIWLECTGKATFVIDRAGDGRGMPLGLWPVRPDRIIPVPDKDTYLKGYLYTAPDGTERVPLRPGEVLFIRRPNPLDLYGGTGPISSVLTDVEAARYAAEWNRNFFNNSAIPGGVIQVENSLTDPEWQALQDRWRETHRGVARAHRVAVLESGATWVPNAHSMRDMDFGNLRTSSRDIIRESLAMHKVMTGVSDDVNRANAQTGEEVFSSWIIKPRLEQEWRDAFNYQLLPMFGAALSQGVEYDFMLQVPQNRELDNAELTAKGTVAVAMVTAGWQPDDVLEAVGWPAMRWVGPPAGAPPRIPVPKLPPGSKEKPGEVGDDAENWAQLDVWAQMEALASARGAYNALAGAR